MYTASTHEKSQGALAGHLTHGVGSAPAETVPGQLLAELPFAGYISLSKSIRIAHFGLDGEVPLKLLDV